MPDSELGGLLRGVVVDNADPEKLGRIKVRVQAAYGDQPVDKLPWAWPCFFYGGLPGMFSYAVPELYATVWVMFLNKDGQPDATFPVWMGVWQGRNEKPIRTDAVAPYPLCHLYKEFQTTSGHSFWISDKGGDEFIEIRDKNESYILMKGGNIEIHAPGNIKITASRIDLN